MTVLVVAVIMFALGFWGGRMWERDLAGDALAEAGDAGELRGEARGRLNAEAERDYTRGVLRGAQKPKQDPPKPIKKSPVKED